MKAAAANGTTSDEEAKTAALIDEYLAEIKANRREIAETRAAGRKILAPIDRNLKQIRSNLSRVATNNWIFRELLLLSRDTKQNIEDIKELQTRVQELSDEVQN